MRTIVSLALLFLFISSSWAGAEDRLPLASKMASRLQARTQSLLDHVLGPGRARIQVTVELEADRVEEIRLETRKGPPLSSRLSLERRFDGARQTLRTVHTISRTVRHTLRTSPRIKRISAVLIVDANLNEGVLLPNVKALLGFDPLRGDRFVSVVK